MRCQNAFAALRIVSETDALLTLAENYARELAPQFGLKVLPLPFKTTPFDAYLYWHKNVDNDPSNRWLREQIQALIR